MTQWHWVFWWVDEECERKSTNAWGKHIPDRKKSKHKVLTLKDARDVFSRDDMETNMFGAE